MSKKLDFVMDVKEVRRLNLEYLIASAGSVKRIAEILGSNASYISQVRNGNANKTMGDSTARRLEKAFGKPHGWMDKLQFDDNENYEKLNDEELLTLSVRTVINQLIAAGIYEPKKSIDIDAVSSLIVTEYKRLLGDKSIKPTGVDGRNQA
tara:strand:+ start:267 stop:719 length:453 start_codon:yes stop_codon:yes gene_type:complete